MTYLAPHPWDEIGPPPPIAADYQTAAARAEGDILSREIEALLARAEDHDSIAEDMERDAEDERTSASEIRDEAEGLIEELKAINSAAADKLGARLDR